MIILVDLNVGKDKEHVAKTCLSYISMASALIKNSWFWCWFHNIVKVWVKTATYLVTPVRRQQEAT